MLGYRLERVEQRLDGIDEHGSRQMLGVIKVQGQHEARLHELEEDVKEVPLLRQDVQRYAESWRAMRTALYAVAATILGAAVFILLLGGGH